MGIDNDTAFGDGPEEFLFREEAGVEEIKKFECFEEEGIQADFGWGFELYFLYQFSFETGILYWLRCDGVRHSLNTP